MISEHAKVLRSSQIETGKAIAKIHEGEGDTHNHKRTPHNRSTRRVFVVQGMLRCSYVGGPAPSEGGH